MPPRFLPVLLTLLFACTGKDPDECTVVTEIPYDGIDQDCDGTDLIDADGDGFDGTGAGGNDCDDGDRSVYPSASEVPYDGVDQDCNGADLSDVDLDGFDATEAGGTDCDDAEPLVHPAATEVAYDGIDQDCDGADLVDVDGDGHDASSVGGDDCADDDATIFSGATDVPYDGIDQDCDGQDLIDADGDGFDAIVAGGDDCDDNAASVNPRATELCDDANVDEDCNGLADDTDALVTGKIPWFPDVDHDGYGAGSPTPSCDGTSGSSSDGTDCDDLDSAINPGATEVCDLLNTDEDCDGLVDDADPGVDLTTGTIYFVDADGDGYGSTAPADFCDLPSSGYSVNETDCDDTLANAHPGGQEVCDDADADEDCDGFVEDGDGTVQNTTSWYVDGDGDGYGGGAAVGRCVAPSSAYVAVGGDCDDHDVTLNPGAVEVCDAADVDEDCDGLADDADPSVDSGLFSSFYVDADEDGYGSPITTLRCDATLGFSADGTDCDDTNAVANPGATEVCDAAWIDEDCDGLSDDDDTSATGLTSFFVDADGDAHGAGSAASVPACHPAAGYSELDDDCDDGDATISPDGVEIVNDGIDQDCSGADLSDTDGDGFPSVETGGDDCDDADPAISPAAVEDESDGVDNDCDGWIDETLVCWDGSGDARTVRQGILATPDGGTVEICPGTYEEEVVLTDRELTIAGGGDSPTDTVIDGTRWDYAFLISGTSRVTVTNLAIESDAYAVSSSADSVSVDLVDLCTFTGANEVHLYLHGASNSVTRSWLCSSADVDIDFTSTGTFAQNVVESALGGYAWVGGYYGTTTIRNNLFVRGTQEIYTNAPSETDLHVYNNTFADGDALVVYAHSYDGVSWAGLSFHDNIVSNMSDSSAQMFDISYYAGREGTPDCSDWVPTPFTANIGYGLDEDWLSCESFCWEDECINTHSYNTTQGPLFQAGFTDVDPLFTSAPGQGSYALAEGSPAIDAGFGADDEDGTQGDLGAFGGSHSEWWRDVPWLE